MSNSIWRYANADNSVVWREWPDGHQESCLVEVIQDWIDEGNMPLPYIAPPSVIPQQVPMWTVRTVLQNDGLFDQINTFIARSADQALKNVWEYGNFADRNSIAINTISHTLGLTEAQVDQMFIDADKLSV